MSEKRPPELEISRQQTGSEQVRERPNASPLTREIPKKNPILKAIDTFNLWKVRNKLRNSENPAIQTRVEEERSRIIASHVIADPEQAHQDARDAVARDIKYERIQRETGIAKAEGKFATTVAHQAIAERSDAKQEAAEAVASTTIDTKTNLPKDKEFTKNFESEMAKVNQESSETQPRGLILGHLDIDNFGSFNRKYSELVGDNVLLSVADTMRDSVRPTDLLGRWGGEELVVGLPYSPRINYPDYVNTFNGIERIRQSIEAMHGEKIPESVTVSVGGTEYIPGETFEDTFKRASKAGAVAKMLGKNRVVVARPNPNVAEGRGMTLVDLSNNVEYNYYPAEIEDGDERLEEVGDRENKNMFTIINPKGAKPYIKELAA